MSYKRNIIPYNPDLKTLARELRRKMTMSEILLWKELKNKQICGFDFDRQRPLDKYIVDFFCKELSLAIEIDGDSHTYKFDYDEERQTRLEKLGVHFLRFEDKEVKKNMWNVLRVIENWINMNEPKKKEPTPCPSEEGNQEEEPVHGYDREVSSKRKPTPSPSEEGNEEKEPTPSPFREKGFKMRKPTPSPSREGSQQKEPTPGPSEEGN
jgi:very-short-patch-repair endonuclease